MKVKSLIAISALLASGAAIAESYQSDIGIVASRIDNGSGVGSKENAYGVTGNYYFDAVKTNNLPLAEAAYLGQNSNVYAGVGRWSGFDTYTVGAEFFIPESFLYVNAGARQVKGHGSSDDDWYTTAGITPVDGLLITTTYDHNQGYDANIKAKYVTALGAGEFINVEAEYWDGEDSTYKSIAADYYLDTTFSIGGMLQNEYSDNTYTVRTRKFFTDNFSGGLSYSDTPRGNEVSLNVNVRF